MKSTFIQLLTAILTDVAVIGDLPCNKMIASTRQGVVVAPEVRKRFLLRMARLQTLAQLFEDEEETLGDPSTLEEISKTTKASATSVMDNYTKLSLDSTARVKFIERLIVELVREEYPSEAEYFNCRYFVNVQGAIIRQKEPQARSLDSGR